MIPYSRDPKDVIPTTSVKIVGLGGAGANMLERIALDGMEGAELIALNTDIRTLGSSMAGEKIQLGLNLTKGLGTGGDPELGHQAVLEAEDEIRAAFTGRRIVFLCVGLGGGTGSGAAAIITRIAREEGAFVVVFATMPFAFEGRRRREQAETALNELAVLSNALVTFDNNRMGELVLAKQGIHDAFVAADRMICESIRAVIRLVVRPGLINVGLDDLMSALKTNRSRCLFGSGIASGKDRASKALRNALASPLLDQGSLLKDAQTLLVHLCGGEDLTLFEIELLMQRLQKHVPDQAHMLFGAAIDPTMGESLSITLISALPEDALASAPRESLSQPNKESPLLDPSQGFTPSAAVPVPAPSVPESAPPVPESIVSPAFDPPVVPTKPVAGHKTVAEVLKTFEQESPPAKEVPVQSEPALFKESASAVPEKNIPEPSSLLSKFRRSLASSAAAAPSLFDDDRPFAEPELKKGSAPKSEPVIETEPEPFDEPEPDFTNAFYDEEDDELVVYEEPMDDSGERQVTVAEFVSTNEADAYGKGEPDPKPIEDYIDLTENEQLSPPIFNPIPRKRPPGVAPWAGGKKAGLKADIGDDEIPPADKPQAAAAKPAADPESPKLKLGVKASSPQSELSFESAPRGRFEGEGPNLIGGEDLDLPPFLRKKK